MQDNTSSKMAWLLSQDKINTVDIRKEVAERIIGHSHRKEKCGNAMIKGDTLPG